MRFSHLQVDRVVMQPIDLPGAFGLAAAMAAMAHGANMTPIAEGIETDREREAVMRAGFLHGQGYYFARP
ncbi:MAG: EAL domain-containing protein (putative c-di-GMP-specific phosphodiesterase class I) [Candidatus Aldehydirespiratoraceae bacterium]|jgi:EAL domain-containing protein (putative c-di-GMP-specific phosphodiesterase class I)